MFRPHLVFRLLVALMLAPIFPLPPHTAAALQQKSIPAPAPSSDRKSITPLLENLPPAAAPPLLPSTFAGWQIAGAPQQSQDPKAADDGDATVLAEFGFTRYESATYRRDADSLTVRAMQFGDATGAFGTFTFYRRPNMQPEPIGQGAAFDGTRVLFWNGAVLVDAKFSRLTAMSAAELRDLATQLPRPLGNLGTLPVLPAYLPAQHLQPMTLQYAIGPQGYRLSGGVLPASLVDFDRSAEVVTAQYNALTGTGTLTIIDYPTPEIAIDRQRAIQAYFSSHGASLASAPGHAGSFWTQALADSTPAAIQSRRSGPLVAITSGTFSAGTAEQLLQQVHYEVNLTMSNSTRYVPDTTKVAQIILNVAFLVGVFALIAIVAALSLGGGRVAWRKLRSKSGAPIPEPGEFIRLNLKD